MEKGKMGSKQKNISMQEVAMKPEHEFCCLNTGWSLKRQINMLNLAWG